MCSEAGAIEGSRGSVALASGVASLTKCHRRTGPALAVFVQDFTDATGLGVTSEPFCFGDPPELADEVAALVRSGRRRATAAMIAEFEHEGEPLPTIGQHSVVYGGGQPVFVIRTEHLSVGPLDEVLDPTFAWDEGEGDRTYEDWLAQQAAYWRLVLAERQRRVQPRPGRDARAFLGRLAAAGRS